MFIIVLIIFLMEEVIRGQQVGPQFIHIYATYLPLIASVYFLPVLYLTWFVYKKQIALEKKMERE